MNKELISTAAALAQEKGIPFERVMYSIEQIFTKVARKKLFGDEKPVMNLDGTTIEPDTLVHTVTVDIDRQTGETVGVVCYQDGRTDPVAVSMDRTTATAIKQRLMDILRAMKKESQVEELLTSESNLFRGAIRSIRKGDFTVELSNGSHGLEGFLSKEERIPGVNYKIGNTVEVFWSNRDDWIDYLDNRDPDTLENTSGVPFDRRVLFSTRSAGWLQEWLSSEIEEIDGGLIEIKAITRKAGLRAKVAILSHLNSNENPLNVIRGFKGTRGKRIQEALAPEQVDFFTWSEDPIELLINALEHTNIEKISVDEANNTISLAAPTESISAIIGKGGANITLLSEMIGRKVQAYDIADWDLREVSEQQWTQHLFIDGLGLSEEEAEILYEEGFNTIQEIAYISMEEALGTGTGDQQTWEQLQRKALAWVNDPDNELEWRLWEQLSTSTPVQLLVRKAGHRNLHDVADFATDELLELVPEITPKQAEQLIMAARDIVYFD